MKKLLSRKFREREDNIKRKFAGKKAEATRNYNQKLKQLLNIK
ncbi:unnamed protein product [marine sediment metagenome]|uniref:Uncharacterized protein n=1 Tax=marine sediment metagenome TaxID=412755 RepID=X1MDR9_9ZZZZ